MQKLIRNKIVRAFEDGTFPLSKQHTEKGEEQIEKEEEQTEKEEEQIKKEEKTIPDWVLVNEPVFKEYVTLLMNLLKINSVLE